MIVICCVILQLALLWGYYGIFGIEILNITKTAVDVNRDGAFEISKYFRRRNVSIFLVSIFFCSSGNCLILQINRTLLQMGDSPPSISLKSLFICVCIAITYTQCFLLTCTCIQTKIRTHISVHISDLLWANGFQ